MAKVHQLILLLGSNIPDRSSYINKSIKLISNSVGTIVKQSSVYESEPWGFVASVAFLNQIVLVETKFEPQEVLAITQKIEGLLGRKKKEGEGYESRTIDIDILFYDDEKVEFPGLIIPHPHVHERLFTLLPLVEVDPGWVHPVVGKTARQLLSDCTDTGKVWRFNNERVNDKI
jgi:2-amino-4-hydroxy-6-hydroxymethyldihydropteridine diphosphokinase